MEPGVHAPNCRCCHTNEHRMEFVHETEREDGGQTVFTRCQICQTVNIEIRPARGRPQNRRIHRYAEELIARKRPTA